MRNWKQELQERFFPVHKNDDHMLGQYWYIDIDGYGVEKMHKEMEAFIEELLNEHK